MSNSGESSRSSSCLWSLRKRFCSSEDRSVEPPWVQELRQVQGLHEVRDRERLMEWLSSDGTTLGDPSRLPWCGDAVETAVKRCLPNEPVIKNPYWSRNWKMFGVDCPFPKIGSIIVFLKREGRSCRLRRRPVPSWKVPPDTRRESVELHLRDMDASQSRPCDAMAEDLHGRETVSPPEARQ